MFGNLSGTEIEHLLRSQVLGRIGCHANKVTYIIPICYAYDDGCIYARTFEGMKLNIMRENPNVCFEIENLESMGKWQSVICWGEFEELIDPNNRTKGIWVLQNRITAFVGDPSLRVSRHWPFSIKSDSAEGIIFCIRVTKKTGKFESV